MGNCHSGQVVDQQQKDIASHQVIKTHRTPNSIYTFDEDFFSTNVKIIAGDVGLRSDKVKCRRLERLLSY
jgi:phosphoribosylcarboxyaminoimidazole (NCAIR) mutase